MAAPGSAGSWAGLEGAVLREYKVDTAKLDSKGAKTRVGPKGFVVDAYQKAKDTKDEGDKNEGAAAGAEGEKKEPEGKAEAVGKAEEGEADDAGKAEEAKGEEAKKRDATGEPEGEGSPTKKQA